MRARALLPLTALLALVATPPGVGPARAASAPRKVKVAVFLVPAQGFAPKTVARVSRKLVKSLRANPRLDVEDADKLFVQFAGEVPTRAINEAQAALEKGLEHLGAGRPREAKGVLAQAASQLERVLAFVKKQSLARAQCGLAVALAAAGDRRAAFQTFVRLLIWRPHFRYDAKTFPPRYIPLFEKARAVLEGRRRGSVELVTQPEGAKAYVDGRFVGVTPTVAFGLVVGDHYATFKKPGFVKAAQKVTVSPTKQERYTQELRRSEKFLLLEQSLEAARAGLGRAKANEAMMDLRSVLYIDQALFVTVGHVAPNQIQVRGYLYDLRSRLRLNQASMLVARESLRGLGRLARLLYVDVRYDGAVEAPPEAPPPPPPDRRPFWATWWFWTAVGAGVATAIVVPVVAWPESETAPDGFQPVLIRN